MQIRKTAAPIRSTPEIDGVEIERVGAPNHWSPANYDVYFRLKDGSTAHFATVHDEDDATEMADTLRTILHLPPYE